MLKQTHLSIGIALALVIIDLILLGVKIGLDIASIR